MLLTVLSLNALALSCTIARWKWNSHRRLIQNIFFCRNKNILFFIFICPAQRIEIHWRWEKKIILWHQIYLITSDARSLRVTDLSLCALSTCLLWLIQYNSVEIFAFLWAKQPDVTIELDRIDEKNKIITLFKFISRYRMLLGRLRLAMPLLWLFYSMWWWQFIFRCWLLMSVLSVLCWFVSVIVFVCAG